ncbi:MAG: DUF433 domain-containing protein [Chloroflexi bacterium]|nr:DUF433 domain-containing protein [Chloroflexota bacterium]
MLPPIIAFSAGQVCQLTGLSQRQLTYWDRTGFLGPEFRTTRRGAFSRVYSFRDVVSLRVIGILRNEHRVPLQRLREIGEYLGKKYTAPWSEVAFYVVGNAVFYRDQETQAMMSGQQLGQSVLFVEMDRVAHDVATRAQKLRDRSIEDAGQIVRNRYVMHNEPVLKGTRIPTQTIWNLHVDGYSSEEILEDYPVLTPQDVKAAIEFERSRVHRRVG